MSSGPSTGHITERIIRRNLNSLGVWSSPWLCLGRMERRGGWSAEAGEARMGARAAEVCPVSKDATAMI